MKRLINFVLPVQTCNFCCHYCYIGQEGRFDGGMGCLQYPPEHMQRAMTQERLGGICHINMCGLGETLLPEYSVELCRRMLENGHFVSIVTNGTITARIKELLRFPASLKQRMFFKFSFHWLELLRTGTLEVFWNNVGFVQKEGVAFSIELTVNDECIEHIDAVRQSCIEHAKACCHVIESRNNNDGFSRLTKRREEEHLRIWNGFQSPLFQFQQEHWMEKREEFCYAGDWAVSLHAESGWMMPCFAGGRAIQNIFEDIEEPIHFMAIGRQCQWKHCYAAHILLSSGVIPQLHTPVYAQFRNRITKDGGSWLTPSVRKFFSEKLEDENNGYSEPKKQWIDALNKIIYQGKFPEEAEERKLAGFLKSSLKREGIKSAAVYGAGKNERWMYGILRLAGIDVKYSLAAVGRQKKSIKQQVKHWVKYPLKKIAAGNRSLILLSAEDKRPRVNAMIVFYAADAARVKKQLENEMEVKVLSELADQALIGEKEGDDGAGRQ